MNARWQRILWALAQLLAGFVGFGAFFVFAPWLATEPIEQAPPEVVAALPSGCPAFSVNHGTYTCEWHDTISRNPRGFALCATIFFAAFGFYAISSMAGRGLAAVEWPSWLRRPRNDG